MGYKHYSSISITLIVPVLVWYSIVCHMFGNLYGVGMIQLLLWLL